MNKFRHLFFDLDGTIFDFQKCEIAALEKAFQTYFIEFSDKILQRYMDINARLWEKHENGEIEQSKLLIYRFEVLFKEFGVEISPAVISEEYQNCLGEMSFFENDALNLLEQLYKKYNLYIVTNGKIKTQISRIERAGIKQYFKNVFISEMIGYNKPQKEFFEVCFQEIGLKNKKEAMVIGDSLTSDILGGKNAGIITCWYNPQNEDGKNGIMCDYEINSLMQLLDIL